MKKLIPLILWVVLAALGGSAMAAIALNRGENVKATLNKPSIFSLTPR